MKLRKLPAKNRLKSRKAIRAVFQKGKVSKAYPIKLLYLKNTESPAFRVGFSAPKRLFPKAVQRNQIKRKMRAGFQSLEQYPKHLDLMFIYIGKEKTTAFKIQKIMHKILAALD